jgi:hypothetical protein
MLAQVQTTYSFKDLLGVLVPPSAFGSPIQLVGGFIGNGEISIRMTTNRTEHETGTDGTVMPSYIAGDAGEITVQCQQTSKLHHALLTLYNAIVLAANAGDISGWATMSISLRTVFDASKHNLYGVSFQKIPDKPYAARGQNVTWVLMAANVVQFG